MLLSVHKIWIDPLLRIGRKITLTVKNNDIQNVTLAALYFYFVFKGRGTVATGRVEQGIIKVGDEVEVLGLMQVC